MDMGSFSIWHWLVVLVIIALVFGTSRLRTIGADVGDAVKSFRKAMHDDDKPGEGADSQLKLDKPGDPSANASVVDPASAAPRDQRPLGN
jgi:sec-independent protein translocase protein TatA